MSFNSIYFLNFIFIVVIVNYFIKQQHRAFFLSIASVFFIFCFNIESLVSLFVFSIFTFLIAFKVSSNKMLFYLSIAINILATVLFNYLTFKNKSVEITVTCISFDINRFLIALGLSFYSLQNISYLIEIRNKNLRPETNFVNYFLFNGFFAKIISGPIIQPTVFFSQSINRLITNQDLVFGFQRILLGLFKKLVVADRLAPAVASIFNYDNNYSGLTTLAAIYLFTLQLYFDFSGYIDIALGAARMVGINLPENFNFPFRSTSISEFWRRWHITLINWLTNYIYYPIVYQLRSWKKMATVVGILITFFVSGIWHGIGFTFLAWAGCHILYLMFELFTKTIRFELKSKISPFLFKLIAVFIVFNLVCFSNVFFRAASFSKAISLIKNVFTRFIPGDFISDFIAPLAVGGHQEERFNFYSSILFSVLFLLFERKINKIAINSKYSVGFIVCSVLLLFIFGIFTSGERFIYMQF